MPRSFKKYLFFAACAALVAAAAYGGLFYHLYRIERASSALAEEVQALQKSSDEQLSLRQLEAEVKDEVSLLRASVVPAEGQVDTITFIESVAREEGTFVEILSVSERHGEPYQLLDFELVAEGSWREAMTFLTKLESMPLKARIGRVDLERIDAIRIYDPSAPASPSIGAGEGVLQAAPREQQVRQTPGWRLSTNISVLKDTTE